jgi:pre-mRNA-splicing factor 38B
MEQYGNLSTYNLESVLKQNIGNSDYYRNDCSKLTTWEAVIDAIYDQVDYLEPWLAGNARGPSTAFCLLHRLFVLKPTEEQVRATITHEDSVYIRAVSGCQLMGAASSVTQSVSAYCSGDNSSNRRANSKARAIGTSAQRR